MENPQPIEISVVYCDLTYPVKLPATATILDLKKKLESTLHIQEHGQFLVSEKRAQLDNADVLGDVFSSTQSNTVSLRGKVQVLVKNKETGYYCPVTVFTDDSVFSMKTFLKKNHGILDAENKKLALVNPSTQQEVEVDEDTEIHTISYPVAIKDGTIFVLK